MAARELERAVEFHERVYGKRPDLVVSVPGRLDFLNTHQDYKGLPVVGVAVNRRLYLAASRGGTEIRLASLNLKLEGRRFTDRFPPGSPGLVGGRWFGDYVRASVKALSLAGYGVEPLELSVSSEVPMGAGMASSAALSVAAVAALSRAAGYRLGLGELAEIAYVAERHVMGVPCGRLDQYTVSYGGVVLVKTREPVEVERLGQLESAIIVADTGIRHSTGEIHPSRQGEINEALRLLRASGGIPSSLAEKLGEDYASTKWDQITVEELARIKSLLPSKLYKRLAYTVLAHESTLEAIKVLRGGKIDSAKASSWAQEVNNWAGLELYDVSSPPIGIEALGLIATYQHYLLSSLYEVSLERLDEIVVSMVEAGALGAKLSGAGLGGAVMGLSEDSKAVRVARLLGRESGLSGVHLVSVDDGVRFHWHP
ncbi:MAG: GHMP kinase [Desulfurococcales archaeon]|nr:GHMP kinase [Desulfurococcales archaeon]